MAALVSVAPARPVLGIKLGGAAITKKSEKGQIHSKNLEICAFAIAGCTC